MRSAALVAAALALAPTPATPPQLGMSAAAPPAPAQALAHREGMNATCMECHVDTAREWRTSLHRASFEDASFQRGYRNEPAAFCRGCHAPESDPQREPDGFGRTHGVACVTCHEAAHDRSGELAPDFGTAVCARCHEFSFPNAVGERGLMQKTMTEHRESPSAGTSCAECHMPRNEEGRRSHAFAVTRDPALLSRALEVKLEGRELVLTARNVGHAFPTGDLFRRLVLRIRMPRGTVEHVFGRAFRAQRDDQARIVRYETRDTRLFPSRRIPLPSNALSYAVVYQRVTSVAQTPPFDVKIEEEVLLAQGLVSTSALPR